MPVTPVSVDPNPSTTATLGSSSLAFALVEGDTSAPPEASTSRVEASIFSPDASAAAYTSSMGRTIASPTSVIRLAFSSWTSCQTFLASNEPTGGSTTFPPPSIIVKAPQ